MDPNTRNTKRNPNSGQRQTSAENDLDFRALLLGSLLALCFAPATFKASKLLETDPIKANLLGCISTIILILPFSLLVGNLSVLQRQNVHNGRLKGRKQAHLSERSFVWSLFDEIGDYIYGQPPAASNRTKARRRQNLDSSYCSFMGAEDNADERQPRIDPKYFKPKFIIHELLNFWDTTCTVITWGSFYVIGGTIVATEKLAHKIKTKRTRFAAGNNLQDATSSGGRFDSFTSSFTSSPQSQQPSRTNSGRDQRQHPLNKISTWTKRSFTSVKKKLAKMTTGTSGMGAMPQIEQPRGLLNTSFLSASFRSS